ncbi:MAG TPA: hypothetical protein VGI74_26555 [Streptosporangiaceae bacterium]
MPTSLGGLPLVVPVVSGAGGVGRSVLAAQLAAALSDRTTDPSGRAVAVCDVSPRAASPWPGWVDHTAQRGTGWLASYAKETGGFAREIKRSTSAIDRGDARPIWVLTDVGPVNPAFSGTYHAPLLWAPLLPYVRAAVIDADPFEGSRLGRQRDGGPVSTMAAWVAAPFAQTAVLWVTDPSPAGLARTVAAVTAAEECGLPMQQFVVAVNDVRGHGWMPRSRSRRTLLADRVGAIVDLGHNTALRDGSRPSVTVRDTAGRDIARLADAVIAAAQQPALAALPAAASASHQARLERTSSHASAAHPLPALG